MTIDLVCVSLEQLIRPQQGERGLQALNLLTSRMSRQAKGHRKSEGRAVSREVSRRVVSRRGGSKRGVLRSSWDTLGLSEGMLTTTIPLLPSCEESVSHRIKKAIVGHTDQSSCL